MSSMQGSILLSAILGAIHFFDPLRSIFWEPLHKCLCNRTVIKRGDFYIAVESKAHVDVCCKNVIENLKKFRKHSKLCE